MARDRRLPRRLPKASIRFANTPNDVVKSGQQGLFGEIYDLRPNQQPFVYDFKHHYVGMGGGWANGKTAALCRKALIIGTLIPGISILLGQITEGQLHRSLIPEFAIALLGRNGTPTNFTQHPSVKSWSKKDMRLEFKSGTVITFFPVGERNKGTTMVEKLQSATFGWVGLDQADNISKDVFDYLLGRNRQRLTVDMEINGVVRKCEFKNQTAITYNPEGYTHWIYQRFIKKARDQVGDIGHWYKAYEYSSEEACLASEETLNKWRNMPEDMRNRFFHGKWGAFSDQAYKEWNENIHVIKPFTVPHEWDFYLVFDYGYGAESCFHIYAVTRKCKETPDIKEGIAFGIWEHYQKEMIPEEHAAIVKAAMEGDDPVKKPRKYSGMWADPSIWRRESKGLTIADEYADHDLVFTKAINDQFLGVERLNKKLQIRVDRTDDVVRILEKVYGSSKYIPSDMYKQGAPHLMYFSNCEHAAAEIPSVRLSDGTLLQMRGMFLKELKRDHAADVSRYFAANLYDTQTPEQTKPKTERGRRMSRARRRNTKWPIV